MRPDQILHSFLHQQKSYINYFFDEVSLSEMETVFHLMMKCEGTIFFSGVGKSGSVALKLAKTLVSIGTKSYFLDPVEALHGDIGIVTSKDVVIFLSKSGSTKELLHLTQLLKRRNITIISFISSPDSPLAEISTMTLFLPLKRELCPHGLAPMTSPSLQMIAGDVLIAAMMQMKSFSIEDYALNHPAGAIGQKITYLVKDLMLVGDDLPLCKEEDLLGDAIVELTNKKRGCLLVVNKEGEMVGIFTDGDLRRAVQTHSNHVFNMSMNSLMIRKFMSVNEEVLALEAINIMQLGERRVMALPVISGKTLKGLICLHDIVQAGLKMQVIKI